VNDPIVSLADVSKTYDGKTLVVNNLSLDVRRGEFLTLLGASGSGKTSSLMMTAGFETPTSGDILLNGKTITNLPAYKRNIGVVFQNYALFPHLTVGKNLAFPLEARGIEKAEIQKRIARMLGMVQLSDYVDRRINQLSGGQQQRVALARALVFDPALVLMDEPLGALDRQLREAMQYEIKNIHRTLGVTVIYVTHDQDEALTMSDRIAVLDKGRIEQIATPSELYERPTTAFVARFVGENNCFRGRARNDPGQTCVVEMGFGLVRATRVNPDQAAGDVLISIRPERIVLNPAPGSVENIFDSVVRDLTYLGDQIRIRIAIGEQDGFVVKIHNHRVATDLSVGQRVTIGWSSLDCRALPSSESEKMVA
jgi:putative spermidine/putrescine transport system ATP-binding protein